MVARSHHVRQGQQRRHQRIVFADVVQTGRIAAEQDEDSPGAREVAAFAAEVARLGA